MKKIFNSLFITLFAFMAFSCSETESPYDPTGGGGDEPTAEHAGTKEDPYTVAEAQKDQSGEVKWVKGYIVGVIKGMNKADAQFATPFESNSNLLLAASADVKDVNNTIPVQLVGGSEIRTVINLQDNPENVGKELLIQGKLIKYFGISGLKETSLAVFDGKELKGVEPEKPADVFDLNKLDASNPVNEFTADFEELTANNNAYELEGWTNANVEGGRLWGGVLFTDKNTGAVDKYIKATAHNGKSDHYETWFITPAFNVDNVKDKTITFDCAGAFFKESTTLKVFFLTKEGDTTVKTEIPVEGIPTSGGMYAWSKGIVIDLAAHAGKTGFVGFQYSAEGGNGNSTTYCIDNISTTGEAGTDDPSTGGDDPVVTEGNPFGLDASTTVNSFLADFENIPAGDDNKNYALKGWTNAKLDGDRVWISKIFKEDKYIQMTGHGGTSAKYNAWFITPAFNVDQVKDNVIKFDVAGAYFNASTSLNVYFLELVNGEMQQTKINVAGIPTEGSTPHSWTKALTIELANFAGKTGFIGFQYLADSADRSFGTYRLDNIGTVDGVPATGGDDEDPTGDDNQPTTGERTNDLIISEYVEGGGLNKAIELYNPTNAAIDLSAYTLRHSSNGSGLWDYQEELEGEIAAGATFVIANHGTDLITDADLLSKSNVMGFNGNDAMALFKGDKLIDVFGIVGKYTSSPYKDKTFRRNSNVNTGSTLFIPEEWTEFAKNAVDGLGSHTVD